jgi:hypothetical protein
MPEDGANENRSRTDGSKIADCFSDYMQAQFSVRFTFMSVFRVGSNVVAM